MLITLACALILRARAPPGSEERILRGALRVEVRRLTRPEQRGQPLRQEKYLRVHVHSAWGGGVLRSAVTRLDA